MSTMIFKVLVNQGPYTVWMDSVHVIIISSRLHTQDSIKYKRTAHRGRKEVNNQMQQGDPGVPTYVAFLREMYTVCILYLSGKCTGLTMEPGSRTVL